MRVHTHTPSHSDVCFVDASHVAVYGRGLVFGIIQTGSWVVLPLVGTVTTDVGIWVLKEDFKCTNTLARKWAIPTSLYTHTPILYGFSLEIKYLHIFLVTIVEWHWLLTNLMRDVAEGWGQQPLVQR